MDVKDSITASLQEDPGLTKVGLVARVTRATGLDQKAVEEEVEKLIKDKTISLGAEAEAEPTPKLKPKPKTT